ncbi:hypothetical protein K438DRAFT_1805793 [Mycena galopus ATCC 62051]|nr:hypothetical protein K438DRAFT_1805793 [Mycena galopus ATCC 62051]
MQNTKAQRKGHLVMNSLLSSSLASCSFRALTSDDLAAADPALTTNLLLVEAMLRFCEYGAGIPDIGGTDQTEDLRQRFVRLKRHIEKALLSEARSDERLERQDRSDAQCDLDLVRDWASEIRQELLEPGQRTQHWNHDSLPWILGYLTTWEDIEFSFLSGSGITLVMRDIIQAPTIPLISYMQPIRSWATSILNRWKLRPEVDALSSDEKTHLGLDIHLPSNTPSPSTDTDSTPTIFYRVGEIAGDFEELKDALADKTTADLSRIFRALDKLEAWKAETEPLAAQCIRDALSRLQTTPGLRHPAKEVGDRMYSVIAAFTNPNAHLQRQVTGFSYYDSPSHSPLHLTFRDKKSIPGATPGMRAFGRKTSDDRIWHDIAVETNATDPINLLFSQFISAANAQHQHPLAPITNFSFTSTPDGKTNEEAQELKGRSWEVSPGRFVQGQVKDLRITDSHIVYYTRSPFSRVSVSELTMKLPQERILPPSCVAPAHWIHPSDPPGGEALWERLPSLAFVGNGHDLYPGATSPPAIASHIYVPRSFERLGLYAPTAYHHEVTKDCTLVKWEPPLTVAQARALLGRAIQYEVPMVPLPPLPEGARPKKKRREDPPPIYWGVVWGVNDADPAALELRIFTGGQHQEAPATLTVGGPCAVPTNRIDTNSPFTPKWVGALELVDEPETSAAELP